MTRYQVITGKYQGLFFNGNKIKEYCGIKYTMLKIKNKEVRFLLSELKVI
ncbi:hypothetical protein [Clostridium sp. M14]|nr:hypothetical protein [Clostridium sp. M14]MBZ9693371.1 hypothetical protein [Clostridium sp. M14]